MRTSAHHLSLKCIIFPPATVTMHTTCPKINPGAANMTTKLTEGIDVAEVLND